MQADQLSDNDHVRELWSPEQDSQPLHFPLSGCYSLATIISTLAKSSQNIFNFCKFFKKYFQLLQNLQKIFSTFVNSSKKVFSTLANSSEGVGRSVRPPAHGGHAVHHVRQAAGQLHQVQGDLISLSTCSLLTESCLSGLEPHRRDP